VAITIRLQQQYLIMKFGRLTGISIIRVEHTEPGEGKGEVDMRFGILAQNSSQVLLTTTARAQLSCLDKLTAQKRQMILSLRLQ
jgi:hypothetical protein